MIAEFEEGAHGAILLPGLAGLATVEGSKKIIARLGPKTSILIAVLVVGALALYFRSEAGRKVPAKVGETARELGPPLAELMSEVVAADQRVSAFAIDRVGSPDALSVVARTLATSSGRMRTRDVAQRLRTGGFSFSGGRSFHTETRAWLMREPCFTEVEYGWWTLGHQADAPPLDDPPTKRIARRWSALTPASTAPPAIAAAEASVAGSQSCCC
jgi:hypothetical protein